MSKRKRVILITCICTLIIGMTPLLSGRLKVWRVLHPSASSVLSIDEKRGDPTYDFIIAKDRLPHFRVYFWVPKSVNHYYPYTNDGIKTDVLGHPPIEYWYTLETGISKDDEKLVYVLVPKRFVFLYGSEFEQVIHLNYK